MRGRWLVIAACMGISLAGVALAAKPKKRESDEKRGETLYQRHCIQCHGANVGGDGQASLSLIQPVPNLRGSWNNERIDSAIPIVLFGRGAMPGYEASFDKRDAERIMKHFAKLASKAETKKDSPNKKPSDN